MAAAVLVDYKSAATAAAAAAAAEGFRAEQHSEFVEIGYILEVH